VTARVGETRDSEAELAKLAALVADFEEKNSGLKVCGRRSVWLAQNG
jgi:hypothetical protein